MLRPKHALAGALILAAISLVSLAASAQTRVEQVRWWHEDPAAVVGYRVHSGPSSGSYTSSVDVGIPGKDAQGAYVYNLTVSATATVYIAVTAYSASAQSPFSNEKVRSAGSPPPPPPPPPPSGPQGSIQGFVLWNAQTDTVLDSDFESGEQIRLATHGTCTAIEVVVNGYLSTNGTPGSVKFELDGTDPACDDPGLDHENEAPFAWEVDEGGNAFACAASLTEAGAHSLTVTPYDGDGCTGTRGTPVTLQFEVVPATTPPPPPPPPAEPLGAPGRPYLVN